MRGERFCVAGHGMFGLMSRSGVGSWGYVIYVDAWILHVPLREVAEWRLTVFA